MFLFCLDTLSSQSNDYNTKYVFCSVEVEDNIIAFLENVGHKRAVKIKATNTLLTRRALM